MSARQAGGVTLVPILPPAPSWIGQASEAPPVGRSWPGGSSEFWDPLGESRNPSVPLQQDREQDVVSATMNCALFILLVPMPTILPVWAGERAPTKATGDRWRCGPTPRVAVGALTDVSLQVLWW